MRKAQSISAVLAPDKTNIAHNNREEEEMKKKRNNHVNKKRMEDNVYLKQQPIEEAYNEIFGDALEEYNDKQKRSDRKIDNYYEHIRDSKRTEEQREMIVQVGSLDDIESGDLGPEEAREMLEEWFEGFQERNPNLVVYNAVIHMDEATPHLHLNFIPVGSDYKRGMDKQVAFDRALSQQEGDYDKSKPFPEWRESEVDAMAEIMAARGIGRKLVGTHADMTVDRFQEVREREKAAEKGKKEVEKGRKEVKEGKKEIREEKKAIQRTKKSLSNKIKEVNEDIRKASKSIQGERDELSEEREGLSEEREELSDTRERLLNTSEELANTRIELDDYADTLKSDREALNSSQEAFDEYVERTEERFSEEAKKLDSERFGVLELMKQLETMTKDQLKAVFDSVTERIDTFTREIEDLSKLSDEDSQQL